MTEAIKKLIEDNRWRPIEEAPKNKKVIVKYMNRLNLERRVMAALYRAGTLQADDCYDGDDIDDNGYFLEDRWHEECESNPDGTIYRVEGIPTHFRTLPDDRLAEVCEVLVVGLMEVLEIYAGIDGFIPATAPEAYQALIIQEMYREASKSIEKANEIAKGNDDA